MKSPGSDQKHEFCPRCEANLTLQKGYDPTLPYWICKGCGEMLINPAVMAEDDIAWICDGCGAMLNIQPGFQQNDGHWICTKCGFDNPVDPAEVYSSEEAYLADRGSPYYGLTQEEVLVLSAYLEIPGFSDRENIVLLEDPESGARYVEKYLTIYESSVYQFLKEHPIPNMPRIHALYESKNCLIVLEEYIRGWTLAEILEHDGCIPEDRAVAIAVNLCTILEKLHQLPTPIVHRDIKPSNVILNDDGKVFLLDMNAAKWEDPQKSDDTRHLGTQEYAAPEQLGYGLTSSTGKADVYAMGILINVMMTGHFPKEKRVQGPLWDIIEKCICLDAQQRYSATELKNALLQLMRG